MAQRELARRRLLDFCTYTFPGYEKAEHLKKLAEYLEALERREIRRLMVFMPPRHGKSEMCSIRFPAWWLGRNPDAPIILASYAANLAYSKSRQCRNLLAERLHQNIFGRYACVDVPIELSEDSKRMDAWELRGHRGGMVAAGVGGGITGYGAKLLIIDDPVKNREEADSSIMRDKAWEWYTSTARTRLEPDAVILLIMTRWHPDDLGGRLLNAEKEGGDKWVKVVLPALAEEGDALGRQEGEALWPDRFPLPDLEATKAAIGPRDWLALYQQRPRPPEGALIRLEWFEGHMLDAEPDMVRVVWCWDLAVSVKERANYTVGARVGVTHDGRIVILNIVRLKAEWPDVRPRIPLLARADPERPTVGVESAAFQLAAVQELARDKAMLGIPLVAIEADRDKQARALPWITRAQLGRVDILRGDWNADFFSEICDFPVGEFDDQVDAVSGAVFMLAGRAPGLVFEAWDEANLSEEADYNPGLPLEWWCCDGYDEGYPRVMVWVQETPGGDLQVFGECYMVRQSADESIGQALAEGKRNRWPKPRTAYVQETALDFKARLWAHDIETVSVSAPAAELVKNVRGFIVDGSGRRRVRVHPRCANLIREMQEYRYGEVGGQPLELNSHGPIAVGCGLWHRRLGK